MPRVPAKFVVWVIPYPIHFITSSSQGEYPTDKFTPKLSTTDPKGWVLNEIAINWSWELLRDIEWHNKKLCVFFWSIYTYPNRMTISNNLTQMRTYQLLTSRITVTVRIKCDLGPSGLVGVKLEVKPRHQQQVQTWCFQRATWALLIGTPWHIHSWNPKHSWKPMGILSPFTTDLCTESLQIIFRKII